MEPIKYPADMLAKGGPPADTTELRSFGAPLADHPAVTLVWAGIWKVVAGENNTVVAEGDLNSMLEYMWEFGWRVEDKAQS